MLQLTPQQRLLLAIAPIDFRKDINTLAALVIQKLSEDPDDGTLFVFTNRAKAAVKILVYDGQGYWFCMKRFSSGKLKWWPKSSSNDCSTRHGESLAPSMIDSSNDNL